MKRTLIVLAFVFGVGIGARAQSYTWAENAACIFYTHCVKCHFPGGPGPFSLIDYGSAYASRFIIKQAILDHYMPPWPPDPSYQTHAHERLLTQQERDILVGWVDGGGLAGNMANAPTAPSYSATGSQLPSIDFSGGIGNYTNTAAVDDYRCFYISTHLGIDKYIEQIELIPGTRSMVHHVLIYYEEDTNAVIGLDNGDPGPGWTNFGGTGLSSSKLICTWTPGTWPLVYPNGMGVKLPANAFLIAQIHYPQGSSGDVDSNTVINLKFASGPVREVTQSPLLDFLLPSQITPYPLHIGANSTATFVETFTVPNITPFPDNFTVLDVLPHMHQVGSSIKVYAIKPGNDTVPLVDIPDWDFKWQGQYSFRQPIVLPEGTVIKAEAFYDNTSANPDAPNPNQDVWAGEASDDEMMQVYFSYLYYQSGDENIIVDTVTVVPTYMGCNFVGIDDIANLNAHVTVFPNPTIDVVNVSFEQTEPGDVQIEVVDISGKIILQYLQPEVGTGTYTKVLDMSTLNNGIYYVRIRSGYVQATRSVIVTK